MNTKILAVLLLFISYNAHSAFMQFNFTGFVSSVENYEATFFDEATLLGQPVSGSFTLDLSNEVRGRLETSWYWWGQVETGLPVLTPQLNLGSETYSLANQGIYNAFEDDFFPEEHIAGHIMTAALLVTGNILAILLGFQKRHPRVKQT